MRLLVTRPMADAVPLAERLAALGHDVVISPLIDIQLTDTPLPMVDACDALALTSANGVRALLAKCNGENLAIWQAKPAYAVGPQTAATLQAAGWQIVHQADGDVAALSALIAQNLGAGQTIWHIAGRDRAGDLAANLAYHNINHQRAVLYRAEAADAFSDAAAMALADRQDPIDGVLLYSARTAEIFCRLVDALPGDEQPDRAKLTAFCLSENLAPIAQNYGYAVRCAATPTEAAMFELLAKHSS